MDEIIKKISYKPDIKYTDEYKSDINFHGYGDSSQDQTDINDNDYNPIDDLISMGDSIQSMVDKLPNDLSDIISDYLDPIIDFVKNELWDKELQKVPVELEWNYIDNEYDIFDETEEKPSIDDPDWNSIWDDNDFVQIEKTTHTLNEIVEKEYIKNLYDLFDEYYNTLHSIITKFWAMLIGAMVNKEISEINMILNDILLSSSEIQDDKKHLLDLAVRSEIHKNMKLAYFSNNFDAEGSMKHLKQFKATYELRNRYSKISKNDNPQTKGEQMSNNMLESMNISYSMKYDKAYENLFRYLKSSNVILDDSLNTSAQSIKARQTLIETKGVK